MRCTNCNASLAKGEIQCTQCGHINDTQENTHVQQGVFQNPSQGTQVCPSCQNEVKDNYKFCEHCGTALSQQQFSAATPPPYGAQYNYQKTPYSNPYLFNVEKEPVIKTSSYLLWMFLMTIPLVGLIIAIIFAVDNKEKNRSNFFKAFLILQLIYFILGLIFFSVLANFIFNFGNYVTEYGIYRLYDYIYLIPSELKNFFSFISFI